MRHIARFFAALALFAMIALPARATTQWSNFYSSIASVQYGQINSMSEPTTFTITSVNTAKSLLVPLGCQRSDIPNTAPPYFMTLTNATTVTVSWAGSGGGVSMVCDFVVIQFN